MEEEEWSVRRGGRERRKEKQWNKKVRKGK